MFLGAFCRSFEVRLQDVVAWGLELGLGSIRAVNVFGAFGLLGLGLWALWAFCLHP